MSNFEFLKSINENLYIIAADAENLFRDKYFEQCMAQTRRLGEHLCRLVMGEAAKPEDTFDTMLATLKDTPSPSEIEKEFIDDLYFLKRAGNKAVHSLNVSNDGKEALECLERAFEASINYAVYKGGASEDLLNKVFDEELLITGQKSKKISLQEEYIAKKKQWIEEEKRLSQGEDEEEPQKSKHKKSKKKKKKQNDVFENDSPVAQEEAKKPLWREILETILAGVLIYLCYLLFFTK